MDKEQILALFNQWWDEGDDIANDGPWEKDTMIQFAFAGYTAAIASYKAELLKEVGEPVAEVIWFDPALELFPSKQPHKIIDGSMSFMDSSKIGTKFYTSDQVAAAIIKATKPLIEERDRAVKRMEAGWIEVCDSGILAFKEMNDELRAQLAAAQEENDALRRIHKENIEILAKELSDKDYEYNQKTNRLIERHAEQFNRCDAEVKRLTGRKDGEVPNY